MKGFFGTKLGTLVAVALVVAISSLGGSLAYALFSTQATATGSTATAATGAILLSDVSESDKDAITNPITVTGLAKNSVEVLGGYIDVKNTDTVQFNYMNTYTNTAGSGNCVHASLQARVEKLPRPGVVVRRPAVGFS